MKDQDNKSPEESLIDQLEEAKKNGDNLVKYGKRFIEMGQQISDLSQVTRGLAKNAPKGIDYEIQNELLNNINKNYRDNLPDLEKKIFVFQNSSSDAYTSTSSGSLVIGRVLPMYLEANDQNALEAIKKYEDFISRPENIKEVVDLLKLWGFDKKIKGQENALKKFQDAHEAFERNESVIAILVPIRECIRLIIDNLLKRRSKEERARNYSKKIHLITDYLKNDYINEQTITEWVMQLEKINDDLSGAKDNEISRDEIHRRLNQATTFIASFLLGLDIKKVNKNRKRKRIDF
jgi:hypothetical protein